MRHLHCLCILCLTMFVSVGEAYAWGQKGHDVTCAIANRHLTKKARKQIHRLLDGYSMVYWSNWLDNASHTPQYAYTKTWHYKNVDKGVAYDRALLEPKGDVVVALKKLMDDLSDRSASDIQKALALKMFIHLVGDLHNPMHMGHRTDLGGNHWAVRFFNRETNLHAIWDTDVIEYGHKWSHTEWAEELDRIDKAKMQEMCQGTFDDWACETMQSASEIYAATPQDSKLSYDYLSQWVPVVERQLLRGGLRLAYLLNKIF